MTAVVLSPSSPPATAWPRHSVLDYYDAEADQISHRIDEALKVTLQIPQPAVPGRLITWYNFIARGCKAKRGTQEGG